MKIVLISDTHEMHEQIVIPRCDILIHAGDLTYRGEEKAVRRALMWLHEQPAKHVVAIAGNHDWLFEKDPGEAAHLVSRTRIIYLENAATEIDGLSIWGSPVTPAFMNWAFNCDQANISKYWDQIPTGTDLLITHGPPRGILDQTDPSRESQHFGCFDLLEAITRVRPKIHVFGHIHGGNRGMGELRGETTFYNASVVNEAYAVVNLPFVIDI